MMPNAPSRTIRSTRCLSLLLSGALMSCDSGKAPEPPALFTWTDGRTIDSTNRFPNVAASIVDVGPNDAGIPVGILGHCTATLIRDRVLLTAGHCVGAALDGAPGGARVVGAEALPPFIHVYVSFSPTALERSTWIPVVRFAGHPSLLPCPNRRCDWEAFVPPVRGLSDVGLLFLAEPVRGVVPAQLGPTDVLTTPRATRAPMTIVGYGLLESMPEEKRAGAWDGLRRVRQKRLAQVVDDTWATWFIPAELCDGDSGGPIFMGNPDRPESLEIVATVSYEGQCRAASIHPRLDNASVQQWIRQTLDAHLQTG